MKKEMIVVLALGVFLISACTQGNVMDNEMMENEENSAMADNSEQDSMEEDSMMEESETMEEAESTKTELKEISNNYYDFNKEAYEKALEEDKVVFLSFVANWCPICQNERPEIRSAFGELNNENVIGFELHYNDNEVTDVEEDLAKQYGVVYQHTKVIVKNDDVVLKSVEAWDKQKTLEEINKVA